MSSTKLPRIRLGDTEIEQLAMLVANLLEDHLRASATCGESTTQRLEDQLHDDNQQDHQHASTEDGLCLHSSVEHGTSTASS